MVVEDTTAPTLSVPATLSIEGTGVLTPVSLTYQADDLYGPVTVSNDAPKEGFPVGTTLITWTAVDANGNTTTTTQQVTITDTTAPSLELPGSLTLEATGADGLTLSPEMLGYSAHDACSGVIIHLSSHHCGFGENTIAVTACDAAGNCTGRDTVITVRDTTAPVIHLSGTNEGDSTVYVEATGPSMAVTLDPPSVEDVSDTTLTNDAPALFPKGTTVVTWTATDAWGNTSTATQKVVVQDTTPPTLELPATLTREATGPNGVLVDISHCPHHTSDSCGCGQITVRVVTDKKYCPLGTHHVLVEACDQDGNCTRKPIDVTIEDTTPPSFQFNQFTDTLWPPNHKWVKVAEVSNVADLVDTDPQVAINVSSNEPLNATGDGNTDQDWKVEHNGDVWAVWLCSERAGDLSGRDYSIDVSVTDASGNTATAQGRVSVPHDMRAKGGKKK